ncbi:MAG: hypothetical protein HY898_32785 [Deltaproteobacteria bacterium]|nr:hypothetical protein [Deltaproteobacteria bacterium]
MVEPATASRSCGGVSARRVLLPIAICAAIGISAFAPRPALAQTPRSAAGPSKSIELRASFSAAASSYFQEPRLRRLLSIELQNLATVSSNPSGPLGDQVAWAWIDLPTESTVSIEARVAGTPALRRTISIEGLGPDAAARHVAIAAAEMIRSLAHPSRVRKPAAGKSPCCEQLETLAHSMPALVWNGGASAAAITGEPMILGGASIGLGLRYHHTGARVTARWLGGRPAFGTLSWLEAGLGVDHRFRLHPSWRLWLGASAAAASLQLGGAQSVDGEVGRHSTWSARAGGSLGVETRLGDSTWLGLAVEPGAILRPVAYDDPSGSGKVGGAWIGFDLSLQYDRRP